MMPEAIGTMAPKAKKSVALSGVVAGNTAICTVGRAGNDLHYRGYDVIELAEQATFEEVAYLLIYEKLPTAAQLLQYKKKLKTLRGLPVMLKPSWRPSRHRPTRWTCCAPAARRSGPCCPSHTITTSPVRAILPIG